MTGDKYSADLGIFLNILGLIVWLPSAHSQLKTFAASVSDSGNSLPSSPLMDSAGTLRLFAGD